MTVDELARAANLMVSTVRLYQHRGLLPPPTKRGRIAWYGEPHLNRLRLIASLQVRGFSLASIRELVDGMDRGDSLRAILGLSGGPSTWTPEPPGTVSLTQLAEALPHAELTPELVQRVVSLGLVELAPDGATVIVRSPSFLRIGSELGALGVPADVILDQYEALRADADRIAERFTELFRTHLWEPFAEEGMPAERVRSMVDTLERLGPLAEGVVIMALRHALQERAENFARAEAERLGVDVPRPGPHRAEPA
ncbi:MAG: MerR family transcriptional regulator [Actinobacteria bacterium]|nr:MerR family transcriptional regulator [Actinomycetota bacterium]